MRPFSFRRGRVYDYKQFQCTDKKGAADIKEGKNQTGRRTFAVEGVKMFREAPAERIEKVYVSESFSAKEECGEVLAERVWTAPEDRR